MFTIEALVFFLSNEEISTILAVENMIILPTKRLSTVPVLKYGETYWILITKFEYDQVFWLGSFNTEWSTGPFQMGFLISSIGISVWSPTSYKYFFDLHMTFWQLKKEFLDYLKKWPS